MLDGKIFLEDKAVLVVKREDENVISGDIYKVREWIEEELENKFGFFVSLQESFEVEDKEYQVYVHTEAYEDLTEDDIEVLEKHNIDDNPEGCTEALSKLLSYSIQFTHYEK